MENNREQNAFSYTYSAKEQAEIKRIREKYVPSEENKIERLRRLDRNAVKKAQTVALSFGVIGTLILGFGMSLAISDLAEMLGLYPNMAMLIGVIVGVIGGGIAVLAYPIHQWILHREQKRIAPEILRLTDELLK